MGRLFVLKDLHDLGDCHAYYLDRSKRMRPLYFRDSPNAPTLEELQWMFRSLELHAVEMGCRAFSDEAHLMGVDPSLQSATKTT